MTKSLVNENKLGRSVLLGTLRHKLNEINNHIVCSTKPLFWFDLGIRIDDIANMSKQFD